LLKLHTCDAATNITQFCNFMLQLDMKKLRDAYQDLKSRAPRRRQRGKKYFVDCHDGELRGSKKPGQREEHLAMALCNDFCQKGGVDHAEISKLQFLDYQFPLKGKQSDAGVGKADLFAVIDGALPCVVELKKSDNREAPLRALLEALAYCAIVEANMESIADDALKKFDVRFAAKKPRLMILAPASYWQFFMGKREAGNWQPAFRNLLDGIHEQIGLRAHLAALPDDVFPLKWENSKPHLQCDVCVLKSVQLAD